MKIFKPMLAPNEKINLDNITYPVLASYKLDGIRCVFKDGNMLSRSLKNIQNTQLREKFKLLAKYAFNNNLILDGELYTQDIPFSMISSCVMTQDHKDKKAIKKWQELCTEYNINITREQAVVSIKFYIFDRIANNNPTEEFIHRLKGVESVNTAFLNITTMVKQFSVENKAGIEFVFKQALANKLEGLILRYTNGFYKYGRGTIKEGLIYKMKPFVTFDAKITGVVQATKVNPDADKKINELGRSVTSKKKDDRILIEKAAAFTVDYNGIEVSPVIADTDEAKELIWKQRDTFIGKWIEYKGMLVGSKDAPRHPVVLRYREDKEN